MQNTPGFFKPKFQPKKPSHGLTINEQIKNSSIRLVYPPELIGIYSLQSAINLAEQAGADLIEINKIDSQSICKIVEVSKYLYDQKKKEKEKKRNAFAQSIHEIQLSPDISTNDIQYRVKKAIDWLKAGDKVKCVVMFKGRQIKNPERGELVLLQFAEQTIEVGVLESLPKLENKKMQVTLKPKK